MLVDPKGEDRESGNASDNVSIDEELPDLVEDVASRSNQGETFETFLEGGEGNKKYNSPKKV